ncbi:MAG: chromosomal replication initiator protein DnaA [Patescibacteria group bacterium]|nr:chromosomal replication initiator protein DnaA [Patescibacteria group bacterium]
MEEQKIWQAALGELELTLSRANFTTWFKNTFITERTEEMVIIAVPNTFTKAWLEKKYHSAILRALQKITSNKIKSIVYRVETVLKIQEEVVLETAEAQPQLSRPEPVPSVAANEFGINPRYRFDNYVIGKGNELAQAASIAVTQKPGNVYNPLFIYGGVGLGKTHLMQAVGNEILKLWPGKKVLYVSCEKFTNDFIKSISSNRADRFKDTYRSVDVLLIDDIQFLAGKEGTQEAFFHTFNDLHQANKQVVITSDRPPKAIPALESRLESRFEWGMIADISSPDLETRAAILKTKCAEKGYRLSDEVITYIATNIQNNVRELEGALNKVMAYNQLNGTEPNLENVKKIIGSLAAGIRKKSITPKQIINIVAEFYDIALDDLLGSCRKKNLALPRQIVMYLMREELKSSYPSIGLEIGKRDHTTAMHAHVKISNCIDDDEKINQDIKLIKEKLYN